jgi:hypothetical protein
MKETGALPLPIVLTSVSKASDTFEYDTFEYDRFNVRESELLQSVHFRYLCDQLFPSFGSCGIELHNKCAQWINAHDNHSTRLITLQLVQHTDCYCLFYEVNEPHIYYKFIRKLRDREHILPGYIHNFPLITNEWERVQESNGAMKFVILTDKEVSKCQISQDNVLIHYSSEIQKIPSHNSILYATLLIENNNNNNNNNGLILVKNNPFDRSNVDSTQLTANCVTNMIDVLRCVQVLHSNGICLNGNINEYNVLLNHHHHHHHHHHHYSNNNNNNKTKNNNNSSNNNNGSGMKNVFSHLTNIHCFHWLTYNNNNDQFMKDKVFTMKKLMYKDVVAVGILFFRIYTNNLINDHSNDFLYSQLNDWKIWLENCQFSVSLKVTQEYILKRMLLMIFMNNEYEAKNRNSNSIVTVHDILSKYGEWTRYKSNHKRKNDKQDHFKKLLNSVHCPITNHVASKKSNNQDNIMVTLVRERRKKNNNNNNNSSSLSNKQNLSFVGNNNCATKVTSDYNSVDRVIKRDQENNSDHSSKFTNQNRKRKMTIYSQKYSATTVYVDSSSDSDENSLPISKNSCISLQNDNALKPLDKSTLYLNCQIQRQNNSEVIWTSPTKKRLFKKFDTSTNSHLDNKENDLLSNGNYVINGTNW